MAGKAKKATGDDVSKTLVGKFKTKVRAVDALQWHGGDDISAVEKFIGNAPVERDKDGSAKFPPRTYPTGELRIHVPLGEDHLGTEGGPGLEKTIGVLELRTGDYLVKDEEGRFTRFRREAFEKEFEAA